MPPKTKAEYLERLRIKYATDTEYRSRVNARTAKWQRENRAKQREAVRKSDRKRRFTKYGWTEEQYNEAAAAQNGVCAICSRPPRGRWKCLVIDHNHKTGARRGLLCNQCNVSLGGLEGHLAEALVYIQKHSRTLDILPSVL